MTEVGGLRNSYEANSCIQARKFLNYHEKNHIFFVKRINQIDLRYFLFSTIRSGSDVGLLFESDIQILGMLKSGSFRDLG